MKYFNGWAESFNITLNELVLVFYGVLQNCSISVYRKYWKENKPACVHARARACVRACVRARVRVCVCVWLSTEGWT